MKLNLATYEEKMKKTLASLETEFKSIRAGRANPAVLDKVMVPYYGTPTQIGSVAEIRQPDARNIVISPWESKLVKDIEKAILASDIGINPVNDGKTVRLTFPPLTEERRKEITKQLSKMGEDSKVALRNIRRDAIDAAKAMKKKSEMTEDEQKQSEKEAQDLVDKYVKLVDGAVETKNKEVMQV